MNHYLTSILFYIVPIDTLLGSELGLGLGSGLGLGFSYERTGTYASLPTLSWLQPAAYNLLCG